MRAVDRPTPPVNLHTDAWLDRWPVRPVIAIGGLQQVAEWDNPTLIYDAEGMAGSARVGVAFVGVARVGQV